MGSKSSACAPEAHASWAIPAPIVPAPSTPMMAAALPARPAEPALSSSSARSCSDIGSLACRPPQAGTSALIPVIARPMISFWIWEVPS